MVADTNPDWNWCSDEFCKDINTNWNGITIAHTFEGIGRLLFETQRLTETLIVWQARYGAIFKGKKNSPDYEFTRENIESCRTIQDIRGSPLGKLVIEMKKCNLSYTKDENALYEILVNRNYFVHTFFADCLSGKICQEDLDRECKRLKKSINTVVKFNNRYLGEIQQDVRRLESQAKSAAKKR